MANLKTNAKVQTCRESITYTSKRKEIADFDGLCKGSSVKLFNEFDKDGLKMLGDKDLAVLKRDNFVEISKRDYRVIVCRSLVFLNINS